MPIIALGSNNKHIHNFRTKTLFECILQEKTNHKIQNIICSGGIVWKNIISEGEKMAKMLQKMQISEIHPDIDVHIETKSTDTAKNIRNSLILIAENELQIPNEKICIFTSDFHIERTRQFAEYILETEFPDMPISKIEMLSAENYASDSHERHLLGHPSWIEMHENFKKWEREWLLVPIEKRERNKPELKQ